jgi:hypothetical protein
MDRTKLQALEAEANRLIKTHGYFVQHVVESTSDIGVPYSFTSGLSYAADPPLPEFVMAGFNIPLMESFLNNAVMAMREGDLILDGAGYYGRHRGQEVGIVPVKPHSSSSRLLLPEDAEAYLIVLPDPNGMFPWEHGCDPSYSAQLAGFDCIELPRPRRASPPSVAIH